MLLKQEILYLNRHNLFFAMHGYVRNRNVRYCLKSRFSNLGKFLLKMLEVYNLRL